MSDGMGREFTYLSSHATYRYFIPNWGIPGKVTDNNPGSNGGGGSSSTGGSTSGGGSGVEG